MTYTWGSFSRRSRKSLKIGWLITVGLVAMQLGWLRPLNRMRGIAESKSTGLGSVAWQKGVGWEPISLWRSGWPHAKSLDTGVVGGVPGGVAMVRAALIAPGLDEGSASPVPPPPPTSEDRKMVRTDALDQIVKNPAQTVDEIAKFASGLGGFLVSSQVNGSLDATLASIVIRVSAARFDEARGELHKLSLRVDSERIEAQDVTRQYVDQDARLRNMRAQEEQYLSILRQAHTVKDTLEVSEKLNEVRGAIEEQQAEFEALSKQIETVALNITLRPEADTRVFGLQWRPLYQLKLAAREGLDGIADYVASMTSFVFYVPTILLWLVTILLGAAGGWRILRWGARRFFGWPAAAKQAA